MPNTPQEQATTRGRPKRTEQENYQRQVATHYHYLLQLRSQFDAELMQRYPDLSSLGDVAQLVLATAEEYRLWAELDNRLLSVQRHTKPREQFVKQCPPLCACLNQLSDTYQLILAQREQVITPCEHEWQHADIDEINQTIASLKTQPAHEQTLVLYGIVLWLRNQCELSHPSTHVQSWRAVIRALLNHFLEYRLGLIYPINGAKTPGRPKLPLPVMLVRAEQALINDYKTLSKICLELQQIPNTPQQLWRQFHNPKKPKIGRKPLTEKKKIEREVDKIIEQLRLLEQRDSSPPKPTQSTRGRKPLTKEQRRQKLTSRKSQLEDKLAKIRP
ncbi:hypothetical protein ACPV5R_04490 [Vibrio astriarenae]